MTTKSKRDRKKANRVEKLARMLEDADALAEEDLDECERPERPASEKAAAVQALAMVRKLRKRLR